MVDSPHQPLLADRPAACWRRSWQRQFFPREPKQHRELVVLHGLSGQMRYLIDGQIVTLQAGSILWAFAGQAHVLLSETPDYDQWVFLVSGRLLTPGSMAEGLPPLRIEDAGAAGGPRVVGARGSAELVAIADSITAMGPSPASLAGYRWWLTRAWQLWQAAPAGRMRAVHPAVDRAAQALRHDPSQSLAGLARSAGLSASRLGRLFRVQTGKSIVQYRAEQKLDRVDRALQEQPKANLLTAALDAGFGGYPQFYRTFRKLRGAAPFDYYRRTDSI